MKRFDKNIHLLMLACNIIKFYLFATKKKLLLITLKAFDDTILIFIFNPEMKEIKANKFHTRSGIEFFFVT